MPTPLEKRLGLVKPIWTQDELLAEFGAYIEEQAKQYDPKWEWEVGGWQMFPNHIGNYRMVVSFDPRIGLSTDDFYEVDPKPRPWKISYKRAWDAEDSGRVGNYPENSFETLDEARAQFALTALYIERQFKEAGITENSVRQGKCSSCGSVYDYDPNHPRGYSGMWTAFPYRQYDDVYDGCRGWD